jgi:SAM-dependent methyltransferase
MVNEQPRHAWVAAQLAAIPAEHRILDAGAGESQYRKHCNHLKYVSQDFGRYDGGGDATGLQTGTWDQSRVDIVCDITEIPEPDESFDAVLCTEVLEHLPSPVAALREMARLLRPGGTMLLTAPFCSLTHFAPYHFCTGFNRYWYLHHLAENGLSPVEIQANGNFFDYVAQEVRRIGSMAGKYASTSLTHSERLDVQGTLALLERLSATQSSSDELLCFGYHVKATKG